MKRALVIALSLVISVALVTTVFAQEKKAEPTKPAATEQKAPAPEKKTPEASKAKAPAYAGKIASMDTGTKLLVVKGKKGEMKFDVANAKWVGYKAMDEVKAGDKVTVNYMKKDGKLLAALVTKAAVKTVQKEGKPGVKPVETTKPASQPAQTPAKQ